MIKVEVQFTRSPSETITVGKLAEDRGRIYFEYSPQFLATGLNLSPFRLPFESGLFEHRDKEFGPLPGLFDDSLPDGWGLLLMDRHFRSRGLLPSRVSPLERLSWLGTLTMGALTYHPPAERNEQSSDSSVFELHDLSQQSQRILSGDCADVLPQLLKAGGSPGGARPKVLVGFNSATGAIISGEDDLPGGFDHWIVKFSGENDEQDAGCVEYAYSLMARAAGIEMPKTRLFLTRQGDRFFGARRFDRESNRRLHVHTFGNLIQSNFRIPSTDYADLIKVTSLLTRNHSDVLRVFRLMVFNVLTNNRDDHVKNVAFLLDDAKAEWTLAPAYDLMFSSGPGGEHTMTVSGEGKNPTMSHLLRLAEGGGVSKQECQRITEEVKSSVNSWNEWADQAGLSSATAGEITQVLTRHMNTLSCR